MPEKKVLRALLGDNVFVQCMYVPVDSYIRHLSLSNILIILTRE
jgi:hypothetical protein